MILGLPLLFVLSGPIKSRRCRGFTAPLSSMLVSEKKGRMALCCNCSGRKRKREAGRTILGCEKSCILEVLLDHMTLLVSSEGATSFLYALGGPWASGTCGFCLVRSLLSAYVAHSQAARRKHTERPLPLLVAPVTPVRLPRQWVSRLSVPWMR